MKKTIIAMLALSGMAMASSLTLVDQWTFDNGVTSTQNRTFTPQNATLTANGGVGTLRLDMIGYSGIHLDDNNTLGLTGGNWAIQLTMQVAQTNTTATAQVLTCLNNATGGTQVAISNPDDGNVYGLCTNGWGGWSANSRTDAEILTGKMVTLTLLNYGGQMYLGQGKTWATFGGGDSCDIGDDTLGKLTIGFGQGGENGVAAQSILIDDISVYSFNTDATAVIDLATVKSDLMANAIPEPTTATLSLLALAGLAARRRRK